MLPARTALAGPVTGRTVERPEATGGVGSLQWPGGCYTRWSPGQAGRDLSVIRTVGSGRLPRCSIFTGSCRQGQPCIRPMQPETGHPIPPCLHARVHFRPCLLRLGLGPTDRPAQPLRTHPAVFLKNRLSSQNPPADSACSIHRQQTGHFLHLRPRPIQPSPAVIVDGLGGDQGSRCSSAFPANLRR